MKSEIELKLLEIADDCGIYPAEVHNEHGIHKRTEWEDGWNAALMKQSERFDILYDWFESLDKDIQVFLGELFKSEIIQLSIRDSKVQPWLLLNDTFAYACADGEDFSLQDVRLLLELYEKYDYDGLTAWAAIKRGMEPIEPWRTEKYHQAVKYLTNAI